MYTARITLSDDSVGVRVFDVKGFALLPDSTQTVKMCCQEGENKQFVLKADDLNILDKLNTTDMLKFAIICLGNTYKMTCSYR